MSDNININVTENIDQVNIVASEVVEVVDLNLYATTEDVTINVTEEIIQVNINKVTSSDITKTSDLINDGEDGTSTYVETNELGAVAFSNDYNDLDNLPTIPESVTKTSELTNDGADGINPFITLEDIPPVTGFVPYTGATQDVDLGEHEIKAGQVEFDQTPTGASGVGVMRWNNTDGTLDLGLKGGNVTLQIGQESVLRVVNKTPTNINLLESNYQAVRVTGAQGQRLKVDLALATNDLLSAETIGLVTETINNNQEGFITTSGLIRGINTTGSLQGETWADGNVLYLSPTTAGRVTNIKPTAPSHLVVIGYVIYAHANQGSIFVKVDNGYELEELHNVTSTNYTTPIDTDSILTYDVTNSLWKRLSWSNIKSNLKTYFDGIYESLSNKSTSTSLGTSNTLYPTQNAVKTYVDLNTTKIQVVSLQNRWTLTNVNIYYRSRGDYSGFNDMVMNNQMVGTSDYASLSQTNRSLSSFFYVANGAKKLDKIYLDVSSGGTTTTNYTIMVVACQRVNSSNTNTSTINGINLGEYSLSKTSGDSTSFYTITPIDVTIPDGYVVTYFLKRADGTAETNVTTHFHFKNA